MTRLIRHHSLPRMWDWPRFDDLFRGFLVPTSKTEQETAWAPQVDVREDTEAYRVEVELPGLDVEDVELTVTPESLTLRGDKKAEERREGEDWHVVERSYGAFSRSIQFPAAIAQDAVEAEAKNGVLTIRLPKATNGKSQKVQIRKS
ncbi:MAG: Hsp20/alpha crystallin family protein [Planctomycetota bacterium]